MSNKGAAWVGVLASLSVSTLPAAETLREALQEAKPSIDLRVRYEGVDQSGFAESADAVTSRMRAGVTTGQIAGTSLLAEAVLVSDLIDDYNSTTNGQSMYPVVADPAGFAAINRLAIVNQSLTNTTFTFGRQRIVLDDARFVGNVGWRQNEQTYDGIRVQHSGGIDADFTYAEQINRIFGPDSDAGRWNGDVFLGNVSKSLGAVTVTVFDYLVELDQAAALSTNTLGVTLTGSRALGGITANYLVSAATQKDVGDNPADFSERYYRLEGGLGIDKFVVGLGYEVLGGDGTTAVSTPLATLHAFQGWADKFLGTPGQGIEDRFLRVGYDAGQIGPFSALSFLGVVHDFAADQGGAAYGDEVDLQVVARTARLAFTLKYASYDTASFGADTEKYWLALDYSF